MTIPTSLILRGGAMLGRRSAIDGSTGGFIKLYSSIAPDFPEDSPSATLVATIPLAYPCGAISVVDYKVVLDMTVPITVSVTTTGLVGFARLVDENDDGLIDMPAGAVGSGMPVILSALQLYAGGEVTLLSCRLSEA